MRLRNRESRVRGSCRAALAVAAIVCVWQPSARAAAIVIDDFSSPTSPLTFMIGHHDPNPLLVKQLGAGMIGGERDVLVNVVGEPAPLSAAGILGGGMFAMATTSPGAVATLQYDGFGACDMDGTGGLFNNQGLMIDLTDDGTNHAFALDFLTVGAGPGLDSVEIEIHLTSQDGEAWYTGTVPEDADPFTFMAGFNDFQSSGNFSFSEITGMTFVLNAGGAANVDFALGSIMVEAPEPPAIVTASLAMAAVVGGSWARRRRARPT